jgi:hypothetical protein
MFGLLKTGNRKWLDTSRELILLRCGVRVRSHAGSLQAPLALVLKERERERKTEEKWMDTSV